MVKRRKDCGLRALVSRSLFHPGSEIVGPGELRKREHENKTGGNWGEKGRGSLSLPSFFLFPVPPPFRVPFTFASSPLSESLERATFLLTSHACSQAGAYLMGSCLKPIHQGLFPGWERNHAWCIAIFPPLPSVWLYSRETQEPIWLVPQSSFIISIWRGRRRLERAGADYWRRVWTWSRVVSRDIPLASVSIAILKTALLLYCIVGIDIVI